MWNPISSEEVVEVCEASEEQEVKESVTVIRRSALSARKPGLEGDWDERDGWIGAMLGARKRVALVEDDEVDDFSRPWTGLGMIGGRLMGLTMTARMLVEWKEGEQEWDWRIVDEEAGEGISKVGRVQTSGAGGVGGARWSVARAENIGRQVELVGRVWGKERLIRS